MTATELPYGDVPGQTHWDGCWRARGHHNCAVRELERLRAAPPAGVVCWVMRGEPGAQSLMCDAPRQSWSKWHVVIPEVLAETLGLAAGECARVRITREEA